METSIVTTVGGGVIKKVLPVYRCDIRNLLGQVKQFFALGLKEITEDMFCPLTGEQLRELFTKDHKVDKLAVWDKVDYMIGLEFSG